MFKNAEMAVPMHAGPKGMKELFVTLLAANLACLKWLFRLILDGDLDGLAFNL